MHAQRKDHILLRVTKGFFRIIGLIFLSFLRGLFFLLKAMNNSAYNGWDTGNADEEEQKGALLKTTPDNIKLILTLASIVIKADGKIQDEERDYIEKKLIKEYDHHVVSIWMSELDEALNHDYGIGGLCNKVAVKFDHATKVQFMYFLCGIVTKDGMLTEAEYDLIKQIGMRIRIPFRTLQSILAMYNFIDEREAKRRQKQKKVKQNLSSLSVQKAYQILEITESASEKEIKKAFRRLAAIHHPDKVVHMGESFRVAANKKFKEILDAYEFIKKKRGIV